MIGVALTEEVEQPEYNANCGFGDVICYLEETAIRITIKTIRWLIDALTWALDLGSMKTDSAYWENATSMASFWLGITSVLGVVIVGAIGIVKGAIKQRREEIVRGVLGVALSVPVCLVSIWLLGTVLNIVDGATKPILEAALGTEDTAKAIAAFLLPFEGTELEEYGNVAYDVQQWGLAILGGPKVSIIIILVVVALIFLAVLVVIGINILRNLLLQMLIAAAPLAFMMMPVQLGKEILMSWAKVTAMILLMKPLVVMYIGMMLGGLFRSSKNIYTLEGLPYVIGLVMVIVVPFAVFAMFNFFGLDTDMGGREAAQHVGSLRSGAKKAAKMAGFGGGGGAAAGRRGGSGGGGGTSGGAATLSNRTKHTSAETSSGSGSGKGSGESASASSEKGGSGQDGGRLHERGRNTGQSSAQSSQPPQQAPKRRGPSAAGSDAGGGDRA